jgi:tripartite-type tricarboxylate transporter receptor subunit TctC
VVQRLAQAAIDVIQDPAMQRRLLDMGVEPTGYGPRKLGEIMKADYERWRRPIQESGFQPE